MPTWIHHGTETESKPLPVACDYCSTVETKGRPNCLSCGGPLPIPETVEHVITREYRITQELMDATCWGDSNKVYVVGKKDHRVLETVHKIERVK